MFYHVVTLFSLLLVSHEILEIKNTHIRVQCRSKDGSGRPSKIGDFHQDNMYSKIGVYRGIHFFLIIALEHRLLVLVRTALRVPTINVLSKNKKNITFFHLKIIFFTAAIYYMGAFS